MTQPPKARSATQLSERFSRPPFERMLRLHDRIKAGTYPNCRKLADELEVSAKTIQRDIDFMRDRLGLPSCLTGSSSWTPRAGRCRPIRAVCAAGWIWR